MTQQHRFAVVSIDRNSGKILWDKTIAKALPHEGGHDSGSLASASPVTDGEQALRRIEATEFDLVLTDLKLPGVSGLEVLKAAQSLRPGSAASSSFQ